MADERQQKHADEIRTVRRIEREFGISFLQARAKLNDFRDEQRQRDADAAAKARTNAADAAPAQPAPRIETEIQSFEPRPFTLGGGTAGSDQPEPPSAGVITNVIFSFNGTLYYCNINGVVTGLV